MTGGPPGDRGAGLTQLKSGAWLRCLGGDLSACPPGPGAGFWLEADVTW